jgi:hypothetical protein
MEAVAAAALVAPSGYRLKEILRSMALSVPVVVSVTIARALMKTEGLVATEGLVGSDLMMPMGRLLLQAL